MTNCTRCGKAFKPTYVGRKFCGRRCANRTRSEQLRGRLHPAIAAHIAKRNADVRDMLRAEFGELSIREIALFKWAWKRAYQRGYNHNYRRVRTEAA